MSPPRPGSRKAQVYECFVASGAQAAVLLGANLGLALGTVKSWIGGWSKTGVIPGKTKPRVSGRRRVCYKVKTPTMFGTIIDEGPQVSEVRWDNGLTQFVSNKQLREVETGR